MTKRYPGSLYFFWCCQPGSRRECTTRYDWDKACQNDVLIAAHNMSYPLEDGRKTVETKVKRRDKGLRCLERSYTERGTSPPTWQRTLSLPSFPPFSSTIKLPPRHDKQACSHARLRMRCDGHDLLPCKRQIILSLRLSLRRPTAW